MKRWIKNTIMIIMIVALGAGAYFTMNYAGSTLQSATPQFNMKMQGGGFGGGMTDMQGGPSSDSLDSNPIENFGSDSSESADTSADSRKGQGRPNMQSGQQGERPERPDGSSDGNSSNQPPEMPSGGEQGAVPSLDDAAQPENNTSDSDSSGSELHSKSDDSHGNMQEKIDVTEDKKLDAFFYVLFAAESLLFSALVIYLIMSGFNKKTAGQTFKSARNGLIYALSVLIVTGALTVAQAETTEKVFANSDSTSQSEMMQGGPNGMDSGSSSVEASGAVSVDGSEQTLDSSYSSSESDESAILVTNGGNAAINNAKISKTGDSTNTENSEFYGVNSGVLVQSGSTSTIDGAEITTDAKGANAVFATGEDAKIYISNSTITTTGSSSSRGLDATYGGYIEADNVTITTQGGSCAALATDRGEGTVIAKNSKLETNGSGSPVIYSTGDISIENTTGIANGSQNVVIEGKNSATVTNSTLTASGKGNRNDVDQAGVMIYQSMSGDASEGTGTFTATGSTLEIQSDSDYYKSAPMFFITNTDAIINLNNTKLIYGSNVLLSAMGTDEWGSSGSNGGNVTLNAENQTLSGNIVADSISKVAVNLISSTYEGTINGDNSAKEVTLTLDKNSTIKLTGDSYVTSLDDADSSYSNIDFNGYTLYVNGEAVK